MTENNQPVQENEQPPKLIRRKRRRGILGFLKKQKRLFISNIKETRRILKPVIRENELSLTDRVYLSPNSLFRIMLFSALCFFTAWMLVLIGQNAVHAMLLNINGINFNYRLFGISYLPGDSNAWEEGTMLLMYSVPYLIYVFLGFVLAVHTSRMKKISWRFRLLLTWFSLHLIVFFLSSLIEGVLLYRGLGIAFHWIIGNFYVRVIVALVVITLVVWLVRMNFGFYFIKTLPVRVFLVNEMYRKTWIAWVAGVAVLPGVITAFIYWFPGMRLQLASVLFLMALIIPALVWSSVYIADVRIPKSDRKVPGYTFILSAGAMLFVALKLLEKYISQTG